MTDKLNMKALNALPQPFLAHFAGGSSWPVEDICVETGLMRINVLGKLDVKRFSEVIRLEDIDGTIHDPDIFWLE